MSIFTTTTLGLTIILVTLVSPIACMDNEEEKEEKLFATTFSKFPLQNLKFSSKFIDIDSGTLIHENDVKTSINLIKNATSIIDSLCKIRKNTLNFLIDTEIREAKRLQKKNCTPIRKKYWKNLHGAYCIFKNEQLEPSLNWEQDYNNLLSNNKKETPYIMSPLTRSIKNLHSNKNQKKLKESLILFFSKEEHKKLEKSWLLSYVLGMFISSSSSDDKEMIIKLAINELTLLKNSLSLINEKNKKDEKDWNNIIKFSEKILEENKKRC